VSTLWTPSGEHPIGREGDRDRPATSPQEQQRTPPGAQTRRVAGPVDAATEEEEQAAAQVEALRRQILSAPPEVVVANHAYGLFELAAIHLSESPPSLEAARLAIDAMASLVEALTGRLGEVENSLREAVSQIRLAFVQIEGALKDEGAPGADPSTGSSASGAS
jgi:hypothetical protein